MKEIDQSHFTFRNAELFRRKIYFNKWSLNQVTCFFLLEVFVGSEKIREVMREEKWRRRKREKK